MDSVTLSGWHQCGIAALQVAYCWGANYNIGIDDPRNIIPDPVALDTPPTLQSIHSLFKPTFALGVDGKGYWWGPPPRATGGPPYTPEVFSGEIPLRAIGTAASGVCGIEQESSTVFCWSDFSWTGPTQVVALPPP
jgi:hypothetical protein